MTNVTQYPSSRSAGDYIHALTKAGVNLVPIIGGTASEVIQFVISPPLERRREAWMNSVGKRLLELEAGGINLENLQHNEQFISSVLQATQAAMRTHQAEKLAALKNASANIARGQSLDDTLLHILLSLIDSLSEMHIRLLKALQEPKIPPEWQEEELHSFAEIVSYNVPGLEINEITLQVLIDLESRRLVGNAITSHQVRNLRDGKDILVTFLGKHLIQLITDSMNSVNSV